MVTEKGDAPDRLRRSVASQGERVRRAADANARTFGAILHGRPEGWFGLMDVWGRNLKIIAALAAMPAVALAPVHKIVTANTRRLSRA